MAYAPPQPSQMFGTTDPREVAESFELYKAALADSHAHTEKTGLRWVSGHGPAETHSTGAAVVDNAIAEIGKSVSPDVLASLTGSLDALRGVTADIGKDWTTTSPLASGLVAFDLQAPAKMLVPRQTPLRNTIPRTKGVGLAARFKRILGFTNAGVGGVADLRPSFNSESITNTFGGVTGLRRPNKISYASDEKVIPYQEVGLSDSVTFKAQYTSMGFENLRGLSQTALLWATLMGEEKMFLFGRGTAAGFEGALAPPTAVTLSVIAASGSQVGNSANIPTLFVYVTSKNGSFGESVASVVASTTGMSAATGRVVTGTVTDAVGALGYSIYVGTTTGIANAFYAGTAQGNSFTVQFTGAGTGGTASAGAQPPAADTSATSADYDGILTVQTDPTISGYVSRMNSLWSTTNAGTEFEAAMSAMYTLNRADPTEIWTYPGGIVALSDLIKNSGSSNYRITINEDATNGFHLGSAVTGILNPITRTMLDFKVHPFMPLGVSLIRSTMVPIPDSEVSNTVEWRGAADYMGIEWPEIQMTYDASTWMLGSLIHYAPAWSAAIVGTLN